MTWSSVVIYYDSHAAPTVHGNSANVLKMGLSNDAHFFQNNK